jgi:hypothetical protein
MLFGRTLPKAINKLHRQDASCSANLDTLAVGTRLGASIVDHISEKDDRQDRLSHRPQV